MAKKYGFVFALLCYSIFADSVSFSSGTIQNLTILSKDLFNEVKRYSYIRSNYEHLKQEMAMGKGEHLYILASLYGCPTFMNVDFAFITQKAYGKIFQNSQELSSQTLDHLLKKELKKDFKLYTNCKEISADDEKNLAYTEDIIFKQKTNYQELIITQYQGDTRLYLDGHIQFSSKDEEIYHEALVHIPISLSLQKPKSVLVLGGGDGMAIREVLKYPSIQNVTIIELDKDMIELFKNQTQLKKLNDSSLHSKKLKIVISDAFRWLQDTPKTEKYDLIIADFPDPSTEILGNLYTVSLYLNVLSHLNKDGIFVTQATSPALSSMAFLCIQETILHSTQKWEKNDVGWKVIPYHTYIPSFGHWGFVVTGKHILPPEKRKPIVINNLSKVIFQPYPQTISFINEIDRPILADIYSRSSK